VASPNQYIHINKVQVSSFTKMVATQSTNPNPGLYVPSEETGAKSYGSVESNMKAGLALEKAIEDWQTSDRCQDEANIICSGNPLGRRVVTQSGDKYELASSKAHETVISEMTDPEEKQKASKYAAQCAENLEWDSSSTDPKKRCKKQGVTGIACVAKYNVPMFCATDKPGTLPAKVFRTECKCYTEKTHAAKVAQCAAASTITFSVKEDGQCQVKCGNEKFSRPPCPSSTPPEENIFLNPTNFYAERWQIMGDTVDQCGLAYPILQNVTLCVASYDRTSRQGDKVALADPNYKNFEVVDEEFVCSGPDVSKNEINPSAPTCVGFVAKLSMGTCGKTPCSKEEDSVCSTSLEGGQCVGK
jgi:hypothetical protein